MRLVLRNNLDKKEYVIQNISDKKDSRLFYHFDIVLPQGMNDGEYEYTLYNDDEVVSFGLAQIGDYIPEKRTYTTENNGYKQYNG